MLGERATRRIGIGPIFEELERRRLLSAALSGAFTGPLPGDALPSEGSVRAVVHISNAAGAQRSGADAGGGGDGWGDGSDSSSDSGDSSSDGADFGDSGDDGGDDGGGGDGGGGDGGGGEGGAF